jgi:hypothetical protein
MVSVKKYTIKQVVNSDRLKELKTGLISRTGLSFLSEIILSLSSFLRTNIFLRKENEYTFSILRREFKSA